MTPPRRWFAFRLRTLLFVVAFLSVPLAWVAYSLNWIKQRHSASYYSQDEPNDPSLPRAPAGLWLFGERGHSSVLPYKATEIERFKRLFPEADVGKIRFDSRYPPVVKDWSYFFDRRDAHGLYELWRSDFGRLIREVNQSQASRNGDPVP
jgi:hypothetical protein